MWPSCQTDIVDQGDRYILRVDLPGFEKEEIHLDVEGGRLTLSAEHKEEKRKGSFCSPGAPLWLGKPQL
ncbi:MAG: Hsp20/alpha crystallin family protein [Hydrogeniiclostridium mannosilyticum]